MCPPVEMVVPRRLTPRSSAVRTYTLFGKLVCQRPHAKPQACVQIKPCRTPPTTCALFQQSSSASSPARPAMSVPSLSVPDCYAEPPCHLTRVFRRPVQERVIQTTVPRELVEAPAAARRGASALRRANTDPLDAAHRIADALGRSPALDLTALPLPAMMPAAVGLETVRQGSGSKSGSIAVGTSSTLLLQVRSSYSRTRWIVGASVMHPTAAVR